MVTDAKSGEMLIRIDERLKQLTINIDSDRKSFDVRNVKLDAEMDKIRVDVDSLRISRAQFLTASALLSFAIGVVVRVFWH